MKRHFLFAAALLGALLFANILSAADAMIEDVEEGGAGKVLPRLVSQPVPALPAFLQKSGVAGKVIVTFTVDSDGSVRDAVVTNSPQRQLNPYALKAVDQWKFEPGTRDGQPASFRLRAAVDFTPRQEQASATSSRGGGTVAAVKRSAPLFWPYEIVMSGRPAWADATFVVDYVGRPLFTVSSGASDKDFAKMAVAMVEASEFSPVRKGSHPAMCASSEHFEFDGDRSLDPEQRRVLAELRKPHPAILNVRDLDERPRVVRQVAPAYPRAMKDDGVTGQAEIEFIVGRDGRVLFPRIISATYDDFGWAASVAVSQWKFAPPQKDGHPVEVRMRIPVLFTAQQLAEVD